MEQNDPLEIIKEGLGGYPLTPLIAEAIKFFLTNRYENLVIINENGEIEFMDRITEKFHNLSRGQGRGKKITEIIPYSELPEVVSMAAERLEPHHLPHYAQDLAATFHAFYRDCRVVSSEPGDAELTKARLRLAAAAKLVLARTLTLMGVGAPDRM